MSVSGFSHLIMLLTLHATGIIILLAYLSRLGLFYFVIFYDLLVNQANHLPPSDIPAIQELCYLSNYILLQRSKLTIVRKTGEKPTDTIEIRVFRCFNGWYTLFSGDKSATDPSSGQSIWLVPYCVVASRLIILPDYKDH